MSWNTFGRVLRFTTWGESHGPAIGVVVDGCPPGIALSEADIQPFLDARRPGQSRFTTQRQEADEVRILSGVFEGRTTGTPISLMIANTDQRSKDYGEIAQSYRPGHADYAYDAKYGIRDYRGGGRSSARETACRVAAGAIARLIIPEVTISGWVEAIGESAIDYARFDAGEIAKNPFFCPDAAKAAEWEELVDTIRKAGSSVGATVMCSAEGVPAGWGREGGRDRRRLRRGAQHRRGQCRCHGTRRARHARVREQPCGRHRGRHLHRPAGRGADRLQAHLVDPYPGGIDHQHRRGNPGAHQGAA